MSRHFDKAEGLYEEKDAATQGFVFNKLCCALPTLKRSLISIRELWE